MKELKKKAEKMMKEANENGLPDPVGNFPCPECGQYLVSIDDNLCPVGICVSCGAKNDVRKCAKDGLYYLAEDGTMVGDVFLSDMLYEEYENE